ncbi:MAG: glycosyltransferase family 4 protein [Gemmatales bacterium]|nr:glycosyltransferase family 4 protein [Gemmatales bacterium]MDW8386156.1 glycosyltransferase family 1 protein [Gemmatales bacterium]
MKNPTRRPLHLGIFADYGTTLQPDEGIGVFVHHLLAALLRVEPDMRITLWVHPGEEHRVQRQLRRYGNAVRVFPPARWAWLGGWLDAIESARCFLRDRLMSRLSGTFQRRFILTWKRGGGFRLALAIVMLMVLPFAWLAAVGYHVLVHGLLRALAFPGEVLLRGWSETHLPRQPDCDVWLLPLGRTSVTFQAPEVVVLWDLAHHHVANVFGPEMAETTDTLFARRVDRAAVVVCGADCVRHDDLLRVFPHAAEKMRVIPLSIPDDMKPATRLEKEQVRQRYGLYRPFLFYPAALRAHKNHATLIEALHRLRTKLGCDLDVVCTGKGELPSDLADLIAERNLQQHVRFLGLVNRDELRALYGLSTATVVPSLHEGFGLPVLEALACGALLTCSDLPSFRELLDGVEDAVILFDSRNPDDVARAVAQTLRDRDRLANAQRRAVRKLAQRTWEDVARDYLEVFRKAMTCAPGLACGEIVEEVAAHV